MLSKNQLGFVHVFVYMCIFFNGCNSQMVYGLSYRQVLFFKAFWNNFYFFILPRDFTIFIKQIDLAYMH